MSMNRIWTIGLVLVIVIVAAAGWMLGISPVLGQAQAAKAEAASMQVSNQSAQGQLAVLQKQFSQLDQSEKKLSGLRSSVTDNAAWSSYIAELWSSSKSSKATLWTVASQNAILYANPASGATATGAPAAGSSSSGSSSTPTPTPTSTAAATTAGAATTKASAKAPTGQLVAIPVTVTVHGTIKQILAFAKAYQSGARLTYMPKLSVESSTKNILEAQMTSYIFVLGGASTLPKSLQGPNDDPNGSTATSTSTPDPTETSAPPTGTPTDTATNTPKP